MNYPDSPNIPSGEDEYYSAPAGPDLADELDRVQEELADAMEVVEDTEHVLMSMINSDDMPDQEVHIEQLEDIFEQARKLTP